jgi:hypothetical protein
MVIRKAQMAAFEPYMLKAFQDRMVAHLRPFAPYPEQQLRAMVVAGIEEASGFKIRSEQEVERYLECLVQYGAGFSTLHWAGPILRDSASTESDKMDRIQWHVLHRPGAHNG